ncbi:outer membrane beta-barrel protein [Marinobacterium sp. 3-1745]|uniref:Outer membrane beta-barrel protein n=2 Tax=Marinobacterium marinum TaxID=2756129 RepID=A0A7W1WVF5_9GAMM|nr:outer membrane beta-barrel protein [Marinobacterium marinum]
MLIQTLPAAADSEWKGQLTPYLWASGLGGDLRPFQGAPTLSFDKSFSDVMDDLDGALFLSGYARQNRFVLLGDYSYSSSSKQGKIAPGLPARGKLSQRSMTLAAGYRAISSDEMTLDVLAGLRAWNLKVKTSVAGGMVQASPSESFVDPLMALRANIALSPQWSTILYVDAGGFGAGSDRTYQVVATVNYQMNDQLYLSAGYRKLNVDYRSGGTKVDVTMAGPLLGMTWRF